MYYEQGLSSQQMISLPKGGGAGSVGVAGGVGCCDIAAPGKEGEGILHRPE